VVTICTASLTFSNSTFCPHSVFMCFVWISEQIAIVSLYNINWLVFITEIQSVYCSVRTGYLCVIPFVFFMSKISMLWWFWQQTKKCKYLAHRCWFQPSRISSLYIAFYCFGNREINFLLVSNFWQRFFFSGQLSALIDWLTDWRPGSVQLHAASTRNIFIITKLTRRYFGGKLSWNITLNCISDRDLQFVTQQFAILLWSAILNFCNAIENLVPNKKRTRFFTWSTDGTSQVVPLKAGSVVPLVW